MVVHQISGQNKANPIATILSFAMMLRYNLDQQELAQNLEDVIQNVLNDGFRTADLYSADSQTLVSCSKMGDLIIERL